MSRFKAVGGWRTTKGAAIQTPRAEYERASAESLMPRFQEKPRVEPVGLPYRSPTQVGEEKILRRLRELSPRNSAN